ncbi:hypothetical protein K1719_003199 [Acacia pycnantha]|nr:hypothetical protein K1719_003199 [Acacia pycnantha]
MVGKLNPLVLLLLSLATLLHSSSAQTRHVVGGNTGWTVPAGGASTYTNWASNETFKQGDTLVFNFATGQHDVAKVTKAAFDACNTGNTIFTLNNGPASVKLNESGEQYYICTVGSHCSLGQKIAINVTNQASSPAGSPAPQPAASPAKSPAPVKAPSPSPASAPSPSSNGSVTYTVGDKTGWTVPSNGAAFYTTWTSGKTFKVGDIVVFNFQKNAHDVAEVTKANYDSCNTSSPLALYNNPPVRVTLNKSGEHYYLCAVPGHCAGGQKLAINVTGASSPATSPSPSPSPAGSPSSPPSPTAPAPGSPASSPSDTNPSSPSPSGAASPPPPNSGATSDRAAGLFATLLLMAAALLC